MIIVKIIIVIVVIVKVISEGQVLTKIYIDIVMKFIGPTSKATMTAVVTLI